MSSHLVRLAQAEREARARGETIDALSLSGLNPDLQAMAAARLMRIDGQGRVQAYLLVATTADEVVADAKRTQGQVERFDESAGIVQSLVPISHIEALAGQPSVGFVRLPDYGFPQTGSVTTEGDSILGADAVRSALAVDGTGVSVGVAAAVKLSFTVEPGGGGDNPVVAAWNRFDDNAPVSYSIAGAIAALLLLYLLWRRFPIRIRFERRR